MIYRNICNFDKDCLFVVDARNGFEDEITFTDVFFECDSGKFPRTTIPVMLQKQKMKNGRCTE